MLLLLVLSFAIGLRITRLNGSYLATEDCYGYPQKPIEWNGLKIELIGAEIVDGEAFLQEYNIDRESIFSDSLSEKYALFHISVTKVSDSPLLTYYRFDYCGAEKDGWRNLVSPEIFESLNPLAKKPSQLSVGETEELAMAIGLHKDAFRNTEWSNLSTSDISLVMSVYPQKSDSAIFMRVKIHRKSSFAPSSEALYGVSYRPKLRGQWVPVLRLLAAAALAWVLINALVETYGVGGCKS